MDEIQRVKLKNLRRRIIALLNEVDPNSPALDDVSLNSLLDEETPTIRRELRYLEEKGFITVRLDRTFRQLSARITAKGRDLAVGEFDEVGVAPVIGDAVAATHIAKMQELERGLAYEFASSVISTNCAVVDDASGADDAYDTYNVEPEDREVVDEALRYLEWILDESEGR